MRILIHSINFYPETAGSWKIYGRNGLLARCSRPRSPRRHSAAILPSMACRAWIPRMALRLAAASLAARKIKDSPMPHLGAEESRWTKTIASPCEFCAQQPADDVPPQVLWRPDLVLLAEPTFCCAPLALLTARLAGATAWLHVQDFEVDAAFKLGDITSSRGQALAQTFEQWLLRKFDRVSAISGQMVSRLLLKGVDQSRRVHFPNWVDTGSIYPLPNSSSFRRELGIAENAIVALYSGSMGKKQGLDLLVEAARQLLHRSDLLFVFCGDGSYRAIFVEKASALSNVTILPFQPSERLNQLAKPRRHPSPAATRRRRRSCYAVQVDGNVCEWPPRIGNGHFRHRVGKRCARTWGSCPTR